MPRNFAEYPHLARQDGGRYEGERNAAHLFAEPRHFAGGDGKRRFGRYVSERRARSARRKYQIAPDVVREIPQRIFNLKALVRNEALFHAHGRRHRTADPGFQGREPFVFIDSGRGPVGN